MSEDFEAPKDDLDKELPEGSEGHSDYKPADSHNESVKHQLTGMYQNWFLDYASYVILERAVPHIIDGLKPVQRRILHSMRRLDDGRYNKVANIVGHTMQFHPHGDASIGDALVQLGQKDLLIDCQGNWGNILTGDGAAAPRYIEARLSKFALEVVFNPKTTEWKLSYDGRNKEPIALPVKFPLLLAQGVEGIAVGLSSKILPHNFNELCDAAISYLHEEDFKLYPDFQTGGSIDVSKYNDGERGGSVKIRARIDKVDNKTLAIKEIPYGKTTSTVIDSILKAVDKGKIKVRKVDDNTSANVEILVHLAPGTSSDKTIDALYAFTDCEISISPNCCVIDDNKPHFLKVSDVLKKSVDNTLALLRQELEIHKGELQESLHFASLEKIFIEERIYKDKEFEQSKDMDAACEHIDNRLTPFYPQFIREVTKEDILRLMEIKMGRILKFNTDKAEEIIAKMKSDIAEIDAHLANIVGYTIDWYQMLKDKYGKNFPRRTELRNFDTIEATKVVEANEKLYINREEGFIGTALKKDEFVACCSDLDDVIIFYRDGKYMITPVADKKFVGKNVLYVNVFKKNDKRTIYNVAYRDGKEGTTYIKRFAVTSIVRDREYDVTQGTPESRITYFSANPNGEAEIIKITLKPNPRVRRIIFERDFSEVGIKSRQAQGVILTRLPVHKIALKQRGGSTLGGRKVWFDRDVLRLNYDGRGEYLGEFQSDDSILVVLNTGEFYTTNFDVSNHYENNVSIVEKFDGNKVWTAALYDADQQNYPYLKRFCFESTTRKQNYLGDNKATQLILLTDEYYPRLEVIFGGHDSFRDPMVIEADEFIAVKGFKAKGKRITTYTVETINELEPTRFPDPPAPDKTEENEEEPEILDPDHGKSEGDILDEMTGQMKLF
ncbi:DNA gyrase/topoisomerase IV subunit A [Bacteroides salyersiae]|jgi:topoisomerase-4 subunit A|uniref:DNA gyrase/topoisomerase IV subunit A n=1 Tax=Bacteroides salyersiae TaxID=291644 RepID=UPI00125DB644|nr:DNA gyrase/topoisomerase IV subunit A [Bacteroides salyersiae]KAB5345889.1 DNA gyrase/topoisomerase IV subunit A [Bacteroides salyersiae]KAB5355665.1 DNA gyrase/topoisomerase IV subunit A [Bacteroides salyersiae]KAB5364071.1 DNA gyrase/topoisomerase IV subunit A [Bacteroides salyersiae]KAB5370460.1 DNA gyrase/topoisomerase IV subunit A [Bacteroides salyersiae]KAB5378055.1 DNA gyrase/topoisomerase IV subunit A [Bacteroides salyersiae]